MCVPVLPEVLEHFVTPSDSRLYNHKPVLDISEQAFSISQDQGAFILKTNLFRGFIESCHFHHEDAVSRAG